MRLKSYFAPSVEAAIVQASRELGEDAMLVDSRKSGESSRHRGEYEVVFAVAPDESARAAGIPERPEPGQPAPGWEKLAREVSDLRRELEKTANAVARAAMWGTLPAARPETARLYSVLVAGEVEPELAREIAETAAAAPAGLEAEIRRQIRVDSRIAPVTALVGPPGAGKTSSLVKLAARFVAASRKPVQILALDNVRVGSAESLRVYAAILGAGFEFLDNVRHLEHAIRQHRHKGLVLVDTPGYAPAEADAARELAQLLVSKSEIDTHLVLTATARNADTSSAVERYEVFRPSKLLFTRLDETDSYGTLLNQAARTRKALSFFSRGQRIPEDLEPASAEAVSRMLAGDPAASAGRAAAA